jgi:hypothetical protein
MPDLAANDLTERRPGLTRSDVPMAMPARWKICLLSALVTLSALALAPSARAASWKPPKALTWYWQLTGTPKIEPVMATDIDGFDNGAAEVQTLHSAGQHAICYIDVGTSEDWRSDFSKFPASVMGNTNGWPGERWLNVADLPVLEPIMTARFQMCQAAGYDAVEPDNTDGYENSTGFSITAAQQATYDEWVANEVHSLGMAVFQKNDPEQASTLEPYFDGVIDEQCNEYSECNSFDSYLNAGKPVLNAEYNGGTAFCAADNAAGIMGALYSVDLDGSTYQPCWPAGTGSTSGAAGSTPPPAAGTGSGAGGGVAGTSGSTTGKTSGKSAKPKHKARKRSHKARKRSHKARKRPHKARKKARRGHHARHRHHHRRRATHHRRHRPVARPAQ